MTGRMDGKDDHQGYYISRYMVFILFQDSYSEVSLGSLLFPTKRGSQLWQWGDKLFTKLLCIIIYMYHVAFGVPCFPIDGG